MFNLPGTTTDNEVHIKMIKKVISAFMLIMLTLTFTISSPQEVKAETEIKPLIQTSNISPLITGPVLMQLLISTVVSVLLSIGISITRFGVEQLLKQWNIDGQEYAEELNGQFNSITDKLVVGPKTLALVYRIRKQLLSQGLTNNGSIDITSTASNPGYTGFKETTVAINTNFKVNMEFTGDVFKTEIIRRAPLGSVPGFAFNMAVRYYLIDLGTDTGVKYYYTPIVHITNTDNYQLNALKLVFSNLDEVNTFIKTIKNEPYKVGSYLQNFDSTGISTSGALDINTGKYTLVKNASHRYAIILYKIESKGVWYNSSDIVDTAVFTTGVSTTKNPNTESNIPIVSESTETVTAGKIDTTDWQKLNPHYTYELQLENTTDSSIINSNQALIDAITQNTVAIKNQQVIDKETGLTVTDINTNVIGISGILNGISNVITSIKEWFISLVQPITNIFTKTYTIEEINALAWVNVINELVLAIQNGVTQILPYYQNNIGSILNAISHPQTNLLTQSVNTILTNTNLYWAVYGIAAIIFIKGVLR